MRLKNIMSMREARRKIKKMRERPECGRRNESKKQTKKKNNDKAIGECVRDSRWEIEVKIKARPKNQSTPKYKLLTFNYLPGKEKHSVPKKGETKWTRSEEAYGWSSQCSRCFTYSVRQYLEMCIILTICKTLAWGHMANKWKSRIQTHIAWLRKLHSEPLTRHCQKFSRT